MNPFVELAKKSVESFVKEGVIVQKPKESLGERRGVFVTIEKEGNLRACIGTYLPTQKTLSEEIIRNAISAATEDYRFGPIKENELDKLKYTVSILEEPVKIKSMEELNPKKYGIIVKSSLKSALLLPDLEGIDTVEEQFSLVCRKGGINPELEEISIFKFEVKKYDQQKNI
jgi:AmmeMemoRadiSam system protein A